MKKKLINRRQFLKSMAAAAGATYFTGRLANIFPNIDHSATAAGLAVTPARSETLTIGGLQWTQAGNFNPLSNGAAWPSQGQFEEIYETLFAFNQITGNLDPLLGKSVTFSSDNLTADITLQDNTKWQDGQSLTTDDILYTYNLAKTQSGLSYGDLFDFITDVVATGSRAIRISLNPSQLNPGFVKNYLVTIKIIPKHIWEGREGSGSLSEYVDMSPVGSGPYKLLESSPSIISLLRDEDYWGNAVFGIPKPKYIKVPIYASTAELDLAFQNGEIDLGQQFTPQIWAMASKGVGTWYNIEPYYVPGSIPMMFINVHKPGLDNALVRRALAYSIDYAQIASTAMSHYSIPVKSSLVIPFGNEQQFYNASQVSSAGWTYDPAKAKDILENQLSAVKGSDGVYVLPGNIRLGPWTVRTVEGWNDWTSACDLVAQNAAASGFDITSEFQTFSDVFTNIQNGDFDLNVWYISGVSPASPWNRFRDVLEDRGVPAIGSAANWNFGRFSSSAAHALLDSAGAASNLDTQKPLFDQLDKIFMDNAPAVPLMYRPLEFYEFNNTYWTGFPTSLDPSSPPMFGGAGIQILYGLVPNKRIYVPSIFRP